MKLPLCMGPGEGSDDLQTNQKQFWTYWHSRFIEECNIFQIEIETIPSSTTKDRRGEA
jgi:hypothetical protein